MKAAVPIDSAGRIVLPKHARRHFHLEAGDRLRLELVPDGILLRAPARRAGLVEENGLLVHEGEAVGDLAQAVAASRTARNDVVLGVRR